MLADGGPRQLPQDAATGDLENPRRFLQAGRSIQAAGNHEIPGPVPFESVAFGGGPGGKRCLEVVAGPAGWLVIARWLAAAGDDR